MRLLICLSVTVLTLVAGIGAEVRDTPPLSLAECIQLGLKNSYDLRIERLNPEIARYNLSGAKGAYEPVFNFRAGEQLLTVPGGTDPKKSGVDSPYELTTDSVGMGVTGVLPTGLQYGVQATSSRLRELTDFSAVPGFVFLYPPNGIRDTNQFTSSAALTLQQPLLRDFWIDRYRQILLVDQKNLKISGLALRWRVMNLVCAIQQSYHQVVYLKEKAAVDAQSLALVEKLAAGTRREIEVGTIPAIELQQVEAQLESARAALVGSRQQLAKQRNALKNLISADYRNGPASDLDVAEEPPPLPGTYDRTEGWRTALEQRPDLAELRLDLEKQGVLVRFQFNQMFPSLDLVGGYGLQSQEGSSEASLLDIRDRTKPQYGFGVVLSIPLGGNRAARNSYRAGKAAKEQAALLLKKKEQDVLVQVDDSLELVRSAYQRTESTHRSRQYAEAALKGEQSKLADGVGTPFFVLQAQQKLSEARTAEIGALMDYRIALAQLDLNEGRTLDENHVHLQLK